MRARRIEQVVGQCPKRAGRPLVCLSVCLEVYTAAPNTALLSTLLPLLDVPHLRCSLLRHLQASPLLASLNLSLSAQSPVPLPS